MTKCAIFPLAAVLCSSLAAQTAAPAPKPAVSPEKKALLAARSQPEPEQKLTALRQFLKDYPKSSRVAAVHSDIFKTLLQSFSDRTAEIDEAAKYQLKGDKGYGKWNEEAYTAIQLAAAEPAGADLPLARKYADDAVKHETEPAANKAYRAYFPKGSPPPKPAEMQSYYKSTRANALTAAAFVDFRQGQLPAAITNVDQAAALAPLSANVSALRGKIAYAQHRNPDALAAFERAQVSGTLSKTDRLHLDELYEQSANPAPLATTLDALYRQLYPLPFTPAPHTPATAGHTALFELYTGSGCPPCVGGDLAVDALLESHPRTELIALAYDLHIPKPDPLTSVDTVARADWDKINSTPSYVLDGKKLGAFGSDREGAREIYDKLSKLVEAQSAKPSAVQLQLTVTPAAAGTLNSHAVVTLGDSAALIQPTPPVEPPDPSEKKPATPARPASPKPAAALPAAAPAAPHYILNFALVEDQVRYSGENGVRFHRMVVRALAKPSETGFPLEPGKALTFESTFDPNILAANARTYLDDFEKSNDRFGPIEFLSKDTSMVPAHLAVAAWVQDADTHRVLQSAFMPVPSPAQAGTR